MKSPKISIVTANYNGEKFLEQTIQSVLNQGYPDLEYIIIDGGSTDGSIDIIKKYEKHLTYWVSEPDNGHGDALNKGFAKSTGEIMAWINSDDMYFPWTFKSVSEIFLKYGDVSWIKGLHSKFSERGILTQSNPVYKNIFDYAQKDYKWIQQESVFWRRTLWEKAGGYINDNYRFMVDGELWSRFFLYEDIWHINIPIGGLRQHGKRRAPNNMSVVLDEMERCIDHMLTKIPRDILDTLPEVEEYKRITSKGEDRIKSLRTSKVLKILPYIIYQYLLANETNKVRKKVAKLYNVISKHPRYNYKKIIFSTSEITREIDSVKK